MKYTFKRYNSLVTIDCPDSKFEKIKKILESFDFTWEEFAYEFEGQDVPCARNDAYYPDDAVAYILRNDFNDSELYEEIDSLVDYFYSRKKKKILKAILSGSEDSTDEESTEENN